MAKNYTSASGFMFQPTQTSIADFNVQQEQLDAGRRQEKRQQDQFQYLKDTREREWREKFIQDNLKQQDFIDVKDADLNNLYARTITKAMDNAGELAMKIAYGKGTPEDRVKLHLLNQTSDKLKALSTSMGDVIQKFNNGELHDDPELRAYLKNLGQAEIDFSEKGELELVVPSENGAKRIPYSDAIKGVDGFKLIPNLDPYKGFAEFTKDIKPEETESYDGYETTKKKGVSTQLATQLAETFLYPSNIMSNHLKSALKKAGFDPFNLTSDAANYAIKLKDELAQQLINSNDRFNKTEYNWTAKQGAERNAETARHNRKSEAISQQNADTSAKNAETSRMKVLGDNSIGGVITDSDSNVFKSAEKKWGKLSNAFVPQKPIEMGTLNIQGKDYQDVKVYGISYDKNGNAVVEIDSETADEFGGSKTRNKTAVKISKQTEAKIANSIGLSSENLRNEIRNTQTTNNDPLGIL